ncbi:MAG: T9SS type B sorting domain-containing protein [Bacteroidetes bacterium]|nr:T9SS type B sorting domain-containing protein [Bacteroidota bacterium]
MNNKRKCGILPDKLRMRHFLGVISLFILLISNSFQAGATHLIGGYMGYEFLKKDDDGKYSYKIMLYMFRDKEQSTVDFDQVISVGVYLNNQDLNRTSKEDIRLIYRKDVKPPGNAECDYYANNEIEMAYYEKVIHLQAYTEGYHLLFVRCCRNIQDNLTLDAGKPFQGQSYYCFIPNPALRNSSPMFSGVPSPYMCAQDTNTFLNRAVDPDGDSLVYRFVWPWQGGEPTQGGAMPDPPTNLQLPIQTVYYRSSFGYTKPFGGNGMAEINPNNGLTTLFAPNEGSYVIAIEVAEYRNGILLSTVRLDMQILVLKCYPNNKPTARSADGHYFEVEAGKELCLETEAKNSDNKPQQVTLYATGDILSGENGVSPPLAVMETKVGTDFVTSKFCWTPSCEQARDKPYLVTISARDNGCPPKEDHVNIEIKVLKFVGSKEILGPDRACSGSSKPNIYTAKDGKPNSTFWWEVTGGTIQGNKTGQDITVIWNGTGNGKIRMLEISEFGCPGDTVSKDITLVPSPALPTISGKDTVCLDESGLIYSVTPKPGSSIKWFLPDGSTSTNNQLTESFNSTGNFVLKLVETNSDGCASDTANFKVNVRKPAPSIIGPSSVCPNSSNIAYYARGQKGSSYSWSVSGGTKVTNGTSSVQLVNWGNEGTGTVETIETDQFGCVSDPVQYQVNKTYNLDGITPEGDISVCEFDAFVPYDVVESSGSTYHWTIAGGNQVAGDSGSLINVTWGAAGNGKVSVQQTAYDQVNKKQCISPVVSIDVKINPIPTADEITGDFELCQGNDETTYSVNGFPGSSYRWTIDGSDQGITGQGTNTVHLIWNIPGTYQISVVELSKDSCPGQAIDTIMVVHPKPVSTEITGALVHCFPDNQHTSYFINGFTNSTYKWWVENGTYSGGDSSHILVDWPEIGYGKIKAVEISEFGCVGDTLQIQVYISNLQIDLELVSVGFPDDRMLGEWMTLNDNLTQKPYEVQKRNAGSSDPWVTVATEDHLSFFESGINTDENAFEYRIKGYDLCGNVRYSEVHTNVLLTGIQDETDFSLILRFSPYLGWDSGVRQYELYKSTNSDQFMRFDKIVTQGETILIDGNSSNFRQCFRIKAIEQDGQNKESWSNEICFYFEPNVYVPTAFTPNKDGVNDVFHPVSVAVQDYKLTLYNRWGQMVYQTDDQTQSWDGTFEGVDSPAGVYMYVISFSDYRNQTYQKNGTIHLMR